MHLRDTGPTLTKAEEERVPAGGKGATACLGFSKREGVPLLTWGSSGGRGCHSLPRIQQDGGGASARLGLNGRVEDVRDPVGRCRGTRGLSVVQGK